MKKQLLAAVTAAALCCAVFPVTALAERPPSGWAVSKSKTATQLDEAWESRVTLSLPSAEYKGDLDIAFVLDGSTSKDETELTAQAAALLDTLAAMDHLDVKVSITIFGGSVPLLESTDLLALSDAANLQALRTILQDTKYDGIAGRSGSNLQAGVEDARAILASDTAVDADSKYMIILTDGAARMWYENGTAYSQTYTDANSIEAINTSGDTHICWNMNDDFMWRYGTYNNEREGDPRPFAEVWAAGQSGTNIGAYRMSGEEKDAAKAKAAAQTLTAEEYGGRIALNKADVCESDTYYTTYEAATYYAATSITAAAEECDMLWVTYPYHAEQENRTYRRYIEGEGDYEGFQDWIGNQEGVSHYDSAVMTPAEVFSGIRNELTYVVDAGSQVIDEMGSGADYHFDFVNDMEKLTLTVGGAELDKTRISDTSYGFGLREDGSYRFQLTYFADGTEGCGECFVWKINEAVTISAPVQLTYAVRLTDPKTAAGTYGSYDADGSNGYEGLYTNNSATLYAKDSSGVDITPEVFGKPTVSYTVQAAPAPEQTPEPTPTPAPTLPARTNPQTGVWA